MPEQYRDPLLVIDGSRIGFYEREFYCFSNFSSFAVDFRGKRYPTSEHAYQAAKFLKTAPKVAERIRNCRSAHTAYKIAQENADLLPADWHDTKVGIMLEVVIEKVCQNPYVWKKLLQTNNVPLAEDSPKDAFWGIGPDGSGENAPGKIWMQVRDMINAGLLTQDHSIE